MQIETRTSELSNATYTTYSFVSRKVNYEVVTTDNKEFSVWSNRFGGAGFGRGTLTVYRSIEELAARSQAFKHLAILIAA